MSELSQTVGHPAGVVDNCLVWGKKPTRLVTRCVGSVECGSRVGLIGGRAGGFLHTHINLFLILTLKSLSVNTGFLKIQLLHVYIC